MLKLSKKADYALIAVRHLATHRGEPSQSASDKDNSDKDKSEKEKKDHQPPKGATRER